MMYRQEPADLVIMDLYMPRKGGLRAIFELRREFLGARIIAMTGSARGLSQDMLRAAEALGAQRTLEKPFDDAQLRAAVRAPRERPARWNDLPAPARGPTARAPMPRAPAGSGSSCARPKVPARTRPRFSSAPAGRAPRRRRERSARGPLVGVASRLSLGLRRAGSGLLGTQE
ncbi:MAG: response regulator [Planctomycetota bacterium]